MTYLQANVLYDPFESLCLERLLIRWLVIAFSAGMTNCPSGGQPVQTIFCNSDLITVQLFGVHVLNRWWSHQSFRPFLAVVVLKFGCLLPSSAPKSPSTSFQAHINVTCDGYEMFLLLLFAWTVLHLLALTLRMYYCTNLCQSLRRYLAAIQL